MEASGTKEGRGRGRRDPPARRLSHAQGRHLLTRASARATDVPAIRPAPPQTSPIPSARSATKWTSGGQRDSFEFHESAPGSIGRAVSLDAARKSRANANDKKSKCHETNSTDRDIRHVSLRSDRLHSADAAQSVQLNADRGLTAAYVWEAPEPSHRSASNSRRCWVHLIRRTRTLQLSWRDQITPMIRIKLCPEILRRPI
jgi:hypothetical protein